jgi:hypothetical protein
MLHWRDTGRSSACMLALVERKSRFSVIEALAPLAGPQ